MSLEVLLALTSFALVASTTPGPNNLMILTSGVNYGFVRTIPHMLGIIFGFAFMIGCIALGLGQILERSPVVFTAIKYAGAAYLLYLAWRIATSGPLKDGDEKGRPMSFFEAAAFQWVNPKGWVMGVTAVAVYTNPVNFAVSAIIVVLVFALATVPANAIWCGFGVALREWLSDPKRLKVFNIVMALLLVASLWPMLR